ncbi:MAG: GNAT family N-acetyltransferase [Anaerolineales bacterium]|nr:GNAT family N-acetyltransferase [Anaerolineales bacterium]
MKHIITHYPIFAIDETHSLWPAFLEVVASLGEVEVKRATVQEEHFLSSHILVALDGDQPVGYLRFVVQRLGEDEDRPLVIFNGRVIEEAKVITFAVIPEYQNRGIGRKLQQAAMKRARTLGCYQFRSRNSYSCEANHHLKISMGFGIQPSLQNDSLYFVLPLEK